MEGTDALEIEVAPGTHTITAEAPDHRLESRTIEIREGDSAEIDLPLTPIAKPVRGRGPVPWIVTGVGVVALASGVGLILVDEDASSDGRSNQTYTDTMLPGVGLTVLGVAGVAFGTYLFVSGPDDRQPVVGVSRDGAWIGYAGSF